MKSILENFKIGKLTIDQAEEQLFELFGIKTDLKTEIEKPMLVGTLNRAFGYNGYKSIEVGTEVFEIRGQYFFLMFYLKDNSQTKQVFNKESLNPFINFLAE